MPSGMERQGAYTGVRPDTRPVPDGGLSPCFIYSHGFADIPAGFFMHVYPFCFPLSAIYPFSLFYLSPIHYNGSSRYRCEFRKGD